jgi:hypothetical protein
MRRRRTTSFNLQLELLETRSIPSASSTLPYQAAFDPSPGSNSRLAGELAQVSSPTKASGNNDGDEVAESPTESPVESPVEVAAEYRLSATSHVARFVLVPEKAADQEPLERAREYTLEGRPGVALKMEESREVVDHKQVSSVRLNAPPSAILIHNELNENPARVNNPHAAEVTFLVSANPGGDTPKRLPHPDSPHSPSGDGTPPTSATAVETDRPALTQPAPTAENPSDWRDILDGFVGIPVPDAVPVDITAFKNDMSAFFTRLVDLDAGSADFTWDDYVCLAAGILLVGGGVQVLRVYSHQYSTRERALHETPEEGQ